MFHRTLRRRTSDTELRDSWAGRHSLFNFGLAPSVQDSGLPDPASLIELWRQALVENARAVKLGAESYPVRLTPKRGLRQVDFVFDGHEMRGLEQNPDTKSRWAQVARSGKKVNPSVRAIGRNRTLRVRQGRISRKGIDSKVPSRVSKGALEGARHSG